ncbi:MAG: hypothetical protein AAB361_02785 [Patescibacteria group bacterium]
MNKNYIIAIIAIAMVVFGAIFAINSSKTNTNYNNSAENSNSQNQSEVKEFNMTSFYEMADDKPRPQYSLKEIIVNKGDTVKVIVTVTKGNHDFNIDEFNVHTETPLNQPVIIEFKADKSGEFVYYCSRPDHRENGHWGTLRVIE